MKLAFLLFLNVLLLSCNNNDSGIIPEIKQIIRGKYKQMRTTLKNGDPDYVLKMHTEDATLFLQNGTEITGISKLRQFYEKVAATHIDIKSLPTSIELLSENMVYEVGTFTSTSKTGSQNTAKYINIWKRVDGDWKIYKAIDQAK